MIEKLYTVEEVAELASVTGRTIRNYLKSGRLLGRKIGGQWRFSEDEVQRLLNGAPEEPDAPVEAVYAGNAAELNGDMPAPIAAASPQSPGIFQGAHHHPLYSTSPASVPTGGQAPPSPFALAPAGGQVFTPAGSQAAAAVPTPLAPVQAPASLQSTQQQLLHAPLAASAQQPAPEAAYPGGVASLYGQSPQASPSPQPLPPLAPDMAAAYPGQAAFVYSFYSQQPQQAAPQAAPATYPGQASPAYAAPQQTVPQQSVPQQPAVQPGGDVATEPAAPAPLPLPQPPPSYAEAYPAPEADSQPHLSYAPPAPLALQNPPAYTAMQSSAGAYAPLAQPAASAPISQAPPSQTLSVTGVSATGDDDLAVRPAPSQQAPAPAQPSSAKQEAPASPATGHNISDVGQRVLKFVEEVHDCSHGPSICAVVDLHQSFSAAKLTGERLTDIAAQESDADVSCQCYVEYDERYFVARYTLMGSSSYLLRCMKLIG